MNKKKTIQRVTSALCIVTMLIGTVFSLSACNIFAAKDEAVYEDALAIIDEAENASGDSEAIQKYQEAIAKLETIPDYPQTASMLEEVKKAHDNRMIEKIKYAYKVDYFSIKDLLAKMYDRKKADSIAVWMDFSQGVIRGYYDVVVKAIKSKLKDPNSFTDVGSSFSYTPVAKNGEKAVIIVHELTYVIDYTATNSFGAAVRDQFKYTLDDVEYKYDSQNLTSEEVIAVVQHLTFDKMCDSLIK